MGNLPLTAFGEVLTARLSPKAGWRADYTVNTRLYSTARSIGGTVTVDENRFKLQTTSTVSRIAALETKKRLRYLPGMGGLLRYTAVFDPAAPVGTYQAVVIGDDQDGFGFGFNGPAFGRLHIRNGTLGWTPETAWEGVSLDFNKAFGNIYQVRYQWLGYGYVRFSLLDPRGETNGYALVDLLKYPNTSQAVHIRNPTLPVTAICSNGSNAYNVVMYTPSAMAFLEGEDELPLHPLDVYNPVDVSKSFSDTNNNHVVTISNKTLFTVSTGPTVTQPNRVPVELVSLTLTRGSAGATLSNVRLYRNGTPVGAVFADVDTLNSPLAVSTSTALVTATNAERAWGLNANGGPLPLNFRPGEVVLPPGESLTLGWQNNGNPATECVVTATLREMF